MMDIDERRYFDNYLELFSSEGWRQFIKDVGACYESLDHGGISILFPYAKLAYRCCCRLSLNPFSIQNCPTYS